MAYNSLSIIFMIISTYRHHHHQRCSSKPKRAIITKVRFHPTRVGRSVAHLHLKGAPTNVSKQASKQANKRAKLPKSRLQGRTLPSVPRSRQAPSSRRRGALVRRLRVRTAAHLRVSTSANVVSSFYKRGACWRDSTDARVRMATTGAWSLLYILWHSRDTHTSCRHPRPPSFIDAGTTHVKKRQRPFGVSRPEGRVNG